MPRQRQQAMGVLRPVPDSRHGSEVQASTAEFGGEDVLAACEAVSRAWLDGVLPSADLGLAVARVAHGYGADVQRVALHIAALTLRSPELATLPPRDTATQQLGLLTAIGALAGASLWVRDSAGALACIASVGEAADSRRAVQVARLAVAGEAADDPGARCLHAVPVMRGDTPLAALVVRARAPSLSRARAVLDETARALAPVVERNMLLETGAAREHSVIEAYERRLSRLAFDLHDEPLQDVAALAAEVRMFRRQLDHLQVSDGDGSLLCGHVDDLEAELGALDRSLRAICRSLESDTTLAMSLEQALERELDSFTRRSRINVELTCAGDFTQLTDSQQIALTRIVQESLSNVREHSGATAAQVMVEATETAIEATIRDDGIGFDVQPTLVRSARHGRLGLVGMHERVRLLGGSCQVDSEPGKATVVRVVLPAWRPLGADASKAAPAADESAARRGATA